jgi:hypothetical protein
MTSSNGYFSPTAAMAPPKCWIIGVIVLLIVTAHFSWLHGEGMQTPPPIGSGDPVVQGTALLDFLSDHAEDPHFLLVVVPVLVAFSPATAE